MADHNDGSPIIGNGREEIATVKEFRRFSSRLSYGRVPLQYGQAPIVHLQGHPTELHDPNIFKSKGVWCLCRVTVHMNKTVGG